MRAEPELGTPRPGLFPRGGSLPHAGVVPAEVRSGQPKYTCRRCPLRVRFILASAMVIATMTAIGCVDRERSVAGEGAPTSINQKANLSNPLKVVGAAGKTQSAARRVGTPPRSGR